MSKLKILIDRSDIKIKTMELARRINDDYKGKKIVVIGVLKGGFMFLADLVREIEVDMEIDFMAVSSYGNATESSGVVRIIKDISTDITDKDVLIVEDLIDTGLTLKYLTKYLKSKGSNSVSICTIFDKPARRKVDLEVKYLGIQIPDEFVVGYGLDFAGKYRNLADLCVVLDD